MMRRKRSVRFGLLAIGCLVMLGCAGSRPPVRTGVVPVRELENLRLPTKDEGLQPGDRVHVQPLAAPELEATATIQPDGSVDLPEIGRVQLAGLTLQRAKAILRMRYGAILKDPELVLEVERVAPLGVYVTGEVRQPGRVTFTSGLTLSRAIILAGGPTPTAKLTSVRILRKLAEGQVRWFDVNLKKTLEGKDDYADPLLTPDDVVVVPPSTIARIEQFVDRYIDGLLPLATITAFAWVYRIVVRGY